MNICSLTCLHSHIHGLGFPLPRTLLVALLSSSLTWWCALLWRVLIIRVNNALIVEALTCKTLYHESNTISTFDYKSLRVTKNTCSRPTTDLVGLALLYLHYITFKTIARTTVLLGQQWLNSFGKKSPDCLLFHILFSLIGATPFPLAPSLCRLCRSLLDQQLLLHHQCQEDCVVGDVKIF